MKLIRQAIMDTSISSSNNTITISITSTTATSSSVVSSQQPSQQDKCGSGGGHYGGHPATPPGLPPLIKADLVSKKANNGLLAAARKNNSEKEISTNRKRTSSANGKPSSTNGARSQLLSEPNSLKNGKTANSALGTVKNTRRKDQQAVGSKFPSSVKNSKVEKMVFAKKAKQQHDGALCNTDDLFNYRIFDDEDSTASDLSDLSQDPCALRGPQASRIISETADDIPLPSVSLLTSDSYLNMDITELRSKLLSQKWLFQKWINFKQTGLRSTLTTVAPNLLTEKRRLKQPGCSTLDVLLGKDSKRVPRTVPGQRPSVASLRKGTCSFSHDEDQVTCERPSLPFTRHCNRHILYNVNQLLFEQCTAKCSKSLTQCSNPAFDIEREKPLCDRHLYELSAEALEPVLVGKAINGIGNAGKGSKRKGKALPLTRPARRKKRARPGPDKGGSLDSTDYQVMSVDSPDGPAEAMSDSEPARGAVTPSLRTNRPVSSSRTRSATASQRLLRSGSLPETTRTTVERPSFASTSSSTATSQTNSPTITTGPQAKFSSSYSRQKNHLHHIFDIARLSALTPPSLTSTSTLSSASIAAIDLPGGHAQGGILPPVSSMDMIVPPLAPGDEALVASIVAQLPLGPVDASSAAGVVFDSELTEVFNKIQDDAFNDLLALDNLKNGLGTDVVATPADIHQHLHHHQHHNQVNGEATYQSQHIPTTVTIPLSTPSSSSTVCAPAALARQLNHQPLSSSAAGIQTVQPVVHLVPQSSVAMVDTTQVHLANPVTTAGSVLPTIQHPASMGVPQVPVTPTRTVVSGGQLNENDILGIASNIFATLTTEQQQQLNGLIDGALASGSLTTSPTLRTALNGW